MVYNMRTKADLTQRDLARKLSRDNTMVDRSESKLTESLAAPLIESTADIYDDLQGIVGKTLQKIEGLDMKLLGSEPAKS